MGGFLRGFQCVPQIAFVQTAPPSSGQEGNLQASQHNCLEKTDAFIISIFSFTRSHVKPLFMLMVQV